MKGIQNDDQMNNIRNLCAFLLITSIVQLVRNWTSSLKV